MQKRRGQAGAPEHGDQLEQKWQDLAFNGDALREALGAVWSPQQIMCCEGVASAPRISPGSPNTLPAGGSERGSMGLRQLPMWEQKGREARVLHAGHKCVQGPEAAVWGVWNG